MPGRHHRRENNRPGSMYPWHGDGQAGKFRGLWAVSLSHGRPNRWPGGRIATTIPGMSTLLLVCCWLRGFLRGRRALTAENLALRQQLAVLRRSVRRPRLRPCDRLFWACLSQCWAGWNDALVIVTPATVVGWHRQGYRLYWRWKSRGRPGRPRIGPEIRRLIRRMGRENPLWGAAHPGGVAIAGPRLGRVHRGQVLGTTQAAAVADLAVFPRQPRGLPGVGRLLRRARAP